MDSSFASEYVNIESAKDVKPFTGKFGSYRTTDYYFKPDAKFAVILVKRRHT